MSAPGIPPVKPHLPAVIRPRRFAYGDFDRWIALGKRLDDHYRELTARPNTAGSAFRLGPQLAMSLAAELVAVRSAALCDSSAATLAAACCSVAAGAVPEAVPRDGVLDAEGLPGAEAPADDVPDAVPGLP